jgi:hypothetical protein
VRSVVFAATLLSITRAAAAPTITVGQSVPVTASELAEAVRLRVDSNARIHVSRDGSSLIIAVDDTTRPIDLEPDTEDSHEAARIAALVIVSLAAPRADGSIVPTTLASSAGAVASARPGVDDRRAGASTTLVGATMAPGTWSLRVGLGMRAARAKVEAFDADPVPHETTTANVVVARRVGSNARLVVGLEWDRATPFADAEETPAMQTTAGVLFARAGVEVAHRWFAVEGGLAAAPFSVCGDEAASSWGPYLSTRVHVLALAAKHRIFGEVGVEQQRMSTASGCGTERSEPDSWPMMLTHTSVHATVGMEVSL